MTYYIVLYYRCAVLRAPVSPRAVWARAPAPVRLTLDGEGRRGGAAAARSLEPRYTSTAKKQTSNTSNSRPIRTLHFSLSKGQGCGKISRS